MTLWPSMLSPVARARPRPFPFGASGTRSFYFARNAVWHGVRLLGLEGREVLVPAYHHGVEVEALVHAGCIPRWVRVDRELGIDLEHLEASIGPRTAAVYVIHYAGFAQPMEEIVALARRRDLLVVEDCALAFLSKLGGRPLGSFGDLAIFCLYKTVPVPNGGLLVANGALDLSRVETEAPPLASTLSHVAGGLLANAAMRFGEAGYALRESARGAARSVRSTARVEHVSTGTRHFDPARLGLGMSALSEVVLDHLDYAGIVTARRRNWFLLLGRLRDLAPPLVAHLPAGACPLFYPLVCGDKSAVQARLAARGIETVDFWRHGHPDCPGDRFPEVEALRERVLEIPVHQDLGPEDVAWVAEQVEECFA